MATTQLITRRSEVQILPPLRRNPLVTGGFWLLLFLSHFLTANGRTPDKRRESRLDALLHVAAVMVGGEIQADYASKECRGPVLRVG